MATLRRLSRRRRIQAENGGDPMLHAVDTFKALFDKEYGGFGSAPKFPMPTNILFLLRQWHGTQDETVREMVETTLTGMYRGASSTTLVVASTAIPPTSAGSSPTSKRCFTITPF